LTTVSGLRAVAGLTATGLRAIAGLTPVPGLRTGSRLRRLASRDPREEQRERGVAIGLAAAVRRDHGDADAVLAVHGLEVLTLAVLGLEQAARVSPPSVSPWSCALNREPEISPWSVRPVCRI